MAIVENEAFEVANGLQVIEENGDTLGPFVTGGPASPVGLDLSTNTYYIQNDVNGVRFWRKIGPLTTDWEEMVTATNALPIDFFEQTKQASETTTGNSFSIYDTVNFNVTETSGVNKYKVQADFFWGHNSAANDIRVQLLVDGVLQFEMRVEPKDPGSDQRIPGRITTYVENLSIGSHTVVLRYRPATASRVSRMFRSVIEGWRVL